MAHCGFKSRSQVTRAIQELVQADLVTVQRGQLALYVLAWPPRPTAAEPIQELVQAEKAARSRTSFEELEEKLRQRKIKDQELKASLEQSAAKEPKTWSL